MRHNRLFFVVLNIKVKFTFQARPFLEHDEMVILAKAKNNATPTAMIAKSLAVMVANLLSVKPILGLESCAKKACICK